MIDDFLTKEQVRRLTGKRARTEQLSELKARGFPFEMNSRGEILVLWSVVEHRMGVKRPTEAAPEPHWDKMYG